MRDWNDQELLREFVSRQSEDAFAELSRRHVSLVFGVAKRKLGRADWAEEVSQAVFIALSRKAAFLCHRRNLSGWLHQTALLECRYFLRGELRRQRREEEAMKLHEAAANDPGLIAEIDEALLQLSEKDRQPLLLRFFEALSFKEVAGALSIKEDAAQKRVAKSLGLLEKLLKRGGRNVGSVALAAALAGAAQAAPTGLALRVANAAFAAGGSTATAAVIFGNFMALTKTKTVVVCALLLSAPLLLQTQRLQSARLEKMALSEALGLEKQLAETRALKVERQQAALKRFEEERNVIRQQVNLIRPTLTASEPADQELYRWSDSADFVRLPKSILGGEVKLTSISSTNSETGATIKSDPFDMKGNFSPALVEGLGLTGQQVGALAASLEHFRKQFEWLARENTVLTNSMPPGIGFKPADGKLYTLVTREFPDQGEELRRQFVSEWETTVGPERAQILMEQGKWVIERAFLNFGKMERWVAAGKAENGLVTVGRSWPKGGVSTGGNVQTITRDQLPEELKKFFPENEVSNE